MTLAPLLICGLLGFLTVLLIAPLTLRLSGAPFRASDLHHTHHGVVPRFGGLALASAWLAVELFIQWCFPQERIRIPDRLVVVLSSLGMFVLGFVDDFKPLGAKKKLAGQILIALGVYYAGVGIETFKIPFSERIISLDNWGVLVTVVWLVGITNLVNLIDGVDGLAAGICLMLMTLLVYVGYQNGAFILLTTGMAGALLAFLRFNFPPAQIYLGDGGAYFLGFQIGMFAIVSSHKGSIMAALIAPLFVLALPIVDTSLAILRRGLRGLPLFRPDRRHLHHHLLNMGIPQRRLVLGAYGLTLVFLLMGFVVCWSRGQWVPVLFGLAVAVLLVCARRLSFSREWFAVGRTVGNSLAMRREVHYALSVTNCLALEGARCSSLAQVFDALADAANRMGFTSVKVTLADGQRAWEQPTTCDRALRTFRLELQGGTCGVIELKAPACFGRNATNRRAAADVSGPDQDCCVTGNSPLFDVMAELLAEGWVRAAEKFRLGCVPLRFHEPAGVNALKLPGFRTSPPDDAMGAAGRGYGWCRRLVPHD